MLKKCLLFILLGQITHSFSQQLSETDSLTAVYNSLEDGKEKVKLSHKLFKLTIRKNKTLAYDFAKEQLEISKKIDYKKGVGKAHRNFAYYYQHIPLPDSARYYFKKSIKIFNENNIKTEQCSALNRFATFEIIQGNFETALQLVDEMENIAVDIKYGQIIVDALQRKSVIYLDLGDYASAMDVTLKSITISDTINPKYVMGKAIGLSDIGRIEIHRNNFQKAIEPTEDALELFKTLDNKVWEATAYNQLGNIYWHLKNYNASLNAYESSLAIVKPLNRKENIASNLANIANIYSKKGEYIKALKLIKEAQAITLQFGTISNIIKDYGNVANIYLENREFSKAIDNYSKAIHIADSVNALDDLYSMYKSRSFAYQKKGDYRNALLDYQSHKKLYDSIFNEKSNKHIEELKTIYETEKKEQQIALQNNEIDLLEQKAKVNNLQKLLLGVGLLLSLIAIGFGLYGFKQKIKRNKAEKEKLDNELDYKKKQLTTHALHLAKKNEVLENLKSKAQEFKNSEENSKGFQQLIRTINFDLQDDKNWENFSRYFEEVHQGFSEKAQQKFPNITSNDLRLMALLKMNLSSREIANILSISSEGIKKARYRLRKKLSLSTEDSLEDFILSF